MTYRLLLLAALIPAACGPLPPPPDTAHLPPGVFDGADQDVPAVQFAAYAFSASSRTYGNPAEGAQAVLAMDYIAGQLNTDPRWAGLDDDTKAQLLEARDQTRATVGIAPNAPSQLVVDSLVTARNDLRADDQPGAAAAVTNAAFTKPPAETIQILGNLPYLREVNVATLHAADELFGVQQGGNTALLGGP
jgi:hypothetical protein